MAVQLNLDWNKIRQEINRLSDINVIKSEVHKVRDEIKNFDYQSYLSPTAKKRVKDVEKRYNKLMKTVGSAQRQLDREFNKLIRQIQTHRDTAQSRIDALKKLAEEQKSKLKNKVSFNGAASSGKTSKKGASSARKKKSTTSAAKKTAAKKTTASKKKKA
jgi:hypothetical protein